MKKPIFFALGLLCVAIIAFAARIIPFGGKPFLKTSSPAEPSAIIELHDGDTYTLEARTVVKSIGGNNVSMLAYNGMIPGPTIKVPQGASVTVIFKNSTDADSSLHSHGIRLASAFDGTHLSQAPVKPGETFTYEMTFPDAGMYWYHPHFNEAYGQERGLYGNFWVVPSDDSYWPPVNREIPLFIDDVDIDLDGITVQKQHIDQTLMGRYGNVFLMNGETKYALAVASGEVVRFYFTNSANTRTFRLGFSGAANMKVIGADSGAFERPFMSETVTIAPSERMIVDVYFPEAGSYDLEHRTPERTYDLGQISASENHVSPSYADAFSDLAFHKTTATSIDPYRQWFDQQPDKRLALDITMSGMIMGGNMGHGGHTMNHGDMMQPSSPDGIEWEDTSGMMNAMSDTQNIEWRLVDLDTQQENMDIRWSFQQGDIVKIRIFNDPQSAHPMQHPIHFHGQRFLVLSRDGAREQDLVWKDTVLIPTGETTDILVEMTNPGMWMAHCHIAEHLEAGMALMYEVI